MMKLRLRPCKREDGREVMKWFSDERQMRMWCRDGFTFPLTDGQMDAYYAELERDPRAWALRPWMKTGNWSEALKWLRRIMRRTASIWDTLSWRRR